MTFADLEQERLQMNLYEFDNTVWQPRHVQGNS